MGFQSAVFKKQCLQFCNLKIIESILRFTYIDWKDMHNLLRVVLKNRADSEKKLEQDEKLNSHIMIMFLAPSSDMAVIKAMNI
jgi:hypothetical protein